MLEFWISVFVVSIWFSNCFADTVSKSTNELCYGPDYPTRQFELDDIVLLKDMCITFEFNQAQQNADPRSSSKTTLLIGLTYDDKLYNQIQIYENNPDSKEQKLCFDVPQQSYICQLCVGFADIYMAFTWAEVCSKLFTTCQLPNNDTKIDSQYTECVIIGDGMSKHGHINFAYANVSFLFLHFRN